MFKDLINKACINVCAQMNTQSNLIDQLQCEISRLTFETKMLSEGKRKKNLERYLAITKTKLAIFSLKSEHENEYRAQLRILKEKIKTFQFEMIQDKHKHNLILINKIKNQYIPDIEKKIIEIEDEIIQQNEKSQDKLFIKIIQPNIIIEIGLHFFYLFLS